MINYKVRFLVDDTIIIQEVQAETLRVSDDNREVNFYVQGVSVGYFVGFVDVLEMP